MSRRSAHADGSTSTPMRTETVESAQAAPQTRTASPAAAAPNEVASSAAKLARRDLARAEDGQREPVGSRHHRDEADDVGMEVELERCSSGVADVGQGSQGRRPRETVVASAQQAS